MIPESVQIREASRDDSAAIAKVIRAAWRGVVKQFGWTKSQLPRSPAYCQANWITDGMDKGERFFVAVSGMKPVGCVGMTAPKGGSSELIRLAVVPEQRRNGLGAMLVEHVVSQAGLLDLTRVELLLIAERTDLLQWYEKLGFVVVRIDSPAHLPFKVSYMSRELTQQEKLLGSRKGSSMNSEQGMPDFWTKSDEYRQAYQKDQQVETVLELLQLEAATGLIDLGCGNGAFAVEAAKRHSKCRVWAFDVLADAVDECRRRAKEAGATNLEAITATAEAVPLPDDCADGVLMRNALHHVARAESVFDEVARLLRGGGRFLLEGPCNPGDDEMGQLLTDIHLLMDSSHRRIYFHPGQVADSLAARGMRIISSDLWPYSFPVGESQVALIQRRKAEDNFHPVRKPNGNWSIQLTIGRVIAVLERGKKP